MNIICNKCQSGRVENFVKDPPKEITVTMEDYVSNAGRTYVTNAVMVYTTYVILCKDCGYRLEYTI